tara:strand:+ start:1361 stop:1936 length:576 start_codon:yes stop_codon:yes gene_type:complete
MEKSLKYLVSITLLILFGFLIKAFSVGNFEFVGYWIVLVSLFLIVVKISDKFKIPTWAIGLFSIWSVLHMAGGLLRINGLRLYDFIFFNILGDPFFILKYDQVIHAYCYFAISILIYFILKNYVKKSEAALVTFTVLAALGIGVLNEVIEFGMVIFLDAADAVGGYYNTALDMLFNLIGAIIGPFVARKFK